MRIGLFSDTYLPDINGVASSIATLKQALENHGHVVFIVANHKGLLNLTREGNILRLPATELNGLYGYRVSSSLQLAAKEEIRKMNLDVIHVHTEFRVGIFARQVAKDLNIPVVSTYHTRVEDEPYYINYFDLKEVEQEAQSLRVAFSKIKKNNIEVVIAPSKKTKEILKSNGVASIHVVPTGIDCSRFDARNVDFGLIQQLKDKYNLKHDDRVVLYLGRVAEEKAIDVAIRGFKKAALTDSKNKLMIVGGGPKLEQLKELALQNGMENAVIFTDRQDYEVIPAFYALADAFVSCSTTETLGLTFIEALSSQLPVFACHDEVIDELIVDNETGFYITEETFSDRFMHYFSLPEEEKQRFKKQAREQALKYDLETYYQKMMNAYNEAYALFHKTFEIKRVKTSDDSVTLTLVGNNDETQTLMVSVEDYFAFDLRKDGFMHELTLMELRKREAYLKAWKKCIRKIAVKDRTRKEIEKFLLSENLSQKQRLDCLEKLEEKGYINDDLYLQTQLEKVQGSCDSKEKIYQKLVKKGFESAKVKESMQLMSDDNEINKATRVLNKIVKSIKGTSVRAKKQMLTSRLISRGFTFEVAKAVIESYDFSEDLAQEDEALTQAIQKATKTYQKKYQGIELKQAILRHLIRKGFNSENVLVQLEEMESLHEED